MEHLINKYKCNSKTLNYEANNDNISFHDINVCLQYGKRRISKGRKEAGKFVE